MFQIAELSRSKEALKEKALRALSDAGVAVKDADGKSDKVKIVFAGQYSAGKSSIIKGDNRRIKNYEFRNIKQAK